MKVPKEIRDEFKDTTPWPESRFSGEVEILLGLEELALHPSRIELRGNLGVFVSPLSNTAILRGRHDKIFPELSYLSQACILLRRQKSPSTQKYYRIKQMDSLFKLGDTMGDYIPETSSNCKKCTKCTFAGRSITQKERIQLEYIERGISHDKENNVFRIKYPFLEDPREALTDNRRQALAYATSLEKKLTKHKLNDKFDEVFQKFITSNSLRTNAEM